MIAQADTKTGVMHQIRETFDTITTTYTVGVVSYFATTEVDVILNRAIGIVTLAVGLVTLWQKLRKKDENEH